MSESVLILFPVLGELLTDLVVGGKNKIITKVDGDIYVSKAE
jgi:hypothetical protein